MRQANVLSSKKLALHSITRRMNLGITKDSHLQSALAADTVQIQCKYSLLGNQHSLRSYFVSFARSVPSKLLTSAASSNKRLHATDMLEMPCESAIRHRHGFPQMRLARRSQHGILGISFSWKAW